MATLAEKRLKRCSNHTRMDSTLSERVKTIRGTIHFVLGKGLCIYIYIVCAQ